MWWFESWRVGELESWRVGELESWRVGELDIIRIFTANIKIKMVLLKNILKVWKFGVIRILAAITIINIIIFKYSVKKIINNFLNY
jgi:hypothetical protein